jgi:hypothetical protein
MFTLKAIDGQLDLTTFDLKALTNKANQTAQEIEKHNQQVVDKFKELIQDYMNKINNIVIDDLELPSFGSINGNNFGYWNVLKHSDGLQSEFKFGHGRASIYIRFNAPKEGKKYTYDFKGTIRVFKYWNDKPENFEYPLESVGQVFKVGADVFKVHIIDRDVKDFNQRKELERQLVY